MVSPDAGVLTERSPQALGRAIRDLLNDPERRQGMAREGRRQAAKRFVYPELVERLHHWLEGVVSHQRT